jgi:hypothetical protein
MATNPAPSEAFVHHSDSSDANRIDHIAEMEAAMRGIQNFHMDVRKWSDIAYHYIVFQPDPNHNKATVFAGRDVHAVPAAQLGHNTGTLAVCVYGNFDRDGVKEPTIDAIVGILAQHHKLVTVGGHRDVFQTDCPGGHLYAHVGEIAKRAGLRRFR